MNTIIYFILLFSLFSVFADKECVDQHVKLVNFVVFEIISHGKLEGPSTIPIATINGYLLGY